LRTSAVLFSLILAVSAVSGQYVEATIYLPDSVSGFQDITSLVYHSPNKLFYVGGSDNSLIAIDAQTNTKLFRVSAWYGPHDLLCSNPTENKVYCASYGSFITVIDGATNQPVKEFFVERQPTDMCYNPAENKLYCGDTWDSVVRVVDCTADSLVTRIPVSHGPGALCFNPQLNRVYCAHSATDEVTAIDCSADTVVDVVWVRGVRPCDICFDSATNCVYTANSGSGSVSVIDCAADTLVRLIAAGREPRAVAPGPPGKVYCANSGDSSVTVISGSGVETVRTCRQPRLLSYDPVNNKLYCAGEVDTVVTVIDAAMDTVLANARTGSSQAAPVLCYNPAGNNTYAAGADNAVISAIGGASDSVEAAITVGACNPGPLCYNTTNNHLYCLDQNDDLLFVIDGESNSVLKSIKTCDSPLDLVCDLSSSKAYFTGWYDSAVFVLDCVDDSTVVAIDIGHRPGVLCCTQNGKVYVAYKGGVAVLDGSGDSVRAEVPVSGTPWALCYDRTDNKMYVGMSSGSTVGVLDAAIDSLVSTIPVPSWHYSAMCWNGNHDKLYVGGTSCDSVVVIDCKSDTVLKKMLTPSPDGLYSDSVCDKVYGIDFWEGYLHIVLSETDSFYKNLRVGYMTTVMDNGKHGPANRLYCIGWESRSATVVGAYKMDSVISTVPVGVEPGALAWNPTYSRIYVSNYGSSSISVIRDTLGPGVEEAMSDERGTMNAGPTVIRGVLVLPRDGLGTRSGLSDNPVMSRAALLDVAGRKVLDLRPGANDVSRLSPGVYFVREVGVSREQGVAGIRKCVLVR